MAKTETLKITHERRRQRTSPVTSHASTVNAKVAATTTTATRNTANT